MDDQPAPSKVEISLSAANCPLCGQANACAMEIARSSGLEQTPCWCTQVSFSPALLARVPLAARDLACVCAACAAKHMAETNPGLQL